MNPIQAQVQARIAALNLKATTETLSDDELQELDLCNTTLLQAKAQVNAELPTKESVREAMVKAGLIKPSILVNPSLLLAGKVLGVIAVAALSAFGGMKYEQRQAGRRNRSTASNDMLGHFDLSTSPQSHPAMSADDGRLAANRSDNVVAHPTATRTARSAAA